MIIKILAVILILLILILILKIKIEFFYSDKKLSIFLKIIFFKKKVRSNKKVKSTIKNKEESEEVLFTDRLIKAQEKIRHFYDVHTKLSQHTKKYLNVEKFKVGIEVGTGDAATTAISVGALWAVVYNFIGALGMLVYIDKPDVEIIPNYSETKFKTNARCIISCRIVHIIFIMMLVLLNIKRNGGRKNERTSN